MTRRAVKKLKAEGRLKTYMDPRLVSALGHPMREHILAVLNERIASATDISREIGVPVEDFYHHFEVLEKQGCIERVDWKPRRGAKEIFFRAKVTLLIDTRAWPRVPASLKSDLAVNNFQHILDDAVEALESGVFSSSDDVHSGWLPGIFDRLGLGEVVALLDELTDRAMAIQGRCAERIAKTGECGIPVTIGFMGFETPSAS